MWIRLLRGGAWILAFGVVACASSQTARQPAEYTRSPALDHVEQPRSASDGKVLGAQEQAPDDWISMLPTNEHMAMGWELRDGRLRFRRERTRGGYGALIEQTACAPPPLASPLRSDQELKARAALYRAWLEAQPSPYRTVALPAVAELATASPHVLDCDR